MKLKNIKDSFNEREIQPSAASWEKLSSKLDKAEKKNKSTYLYWLGAVAAILILALIIYPTFSQINTGELQENYQMVNEELDHKNQLNDQPERNIEIATEEIAVENQIKKEKESKATLGKKVPAKRKVKQATPRAIQESIAIAINHSDATDGIEKVDDNVSVSERYSFENAVAESPKVPNTPEEEAAFLLESILGTQDNQTEVVTHKLNPKQLLRETEWDIEADRRNLLNKSLKDGLGKLKNEAFAIMGVDN